MTIPIKGYAKLHRVGTSALRMQIDKRKLKLLRHRRKTLLLTSEVEVGRMPVFTEYRKLAIFAPKNLQF